MLEKKAEEVRRSMSAQKAAQVVARLDVPSDEGDLSQQHHEEWIFLNRNTIDMKLLREIADALHRIEQDTTASAWNAKSRFPPSGWMPCRGRAIASRARNRSPRASPPGEVVDEFQEADR